MNIAQHIPEAAAATTIAPPPGDEDKSSRGSPMQYYADILYTPPQCRAPFRVSSLVPDLLRRYKRRNGDMPTSECLDTLVCSSRRTDRAGHCRYRYGFQEFQISAQAGLFALRDNVHPEHKTSGRRWIHALSPL